MMTDTEKLRITEQAFSVEIRNHSQAKADLAALRAENARLRDALFELDEFSPPDNSCIHTLRQDGRVCVYYTIPHESTHYVIYDSLDSTTLVPAVKGAVTMAKHPDYVLRKNAQRGAITTKCPGCHRKSALSRMMTNFSNPLVPGWKAYRICRSIVDTKR